MGGYPATSCLTTFDCPSSNVTSLRRNTSNTPIGALVTLNNTVYVEAARALARTVMVAHGSDDARMAYLLRRSPSARFFTFEWQEQMKRIEDCQDCGECRERCPYELDTPALLKKMLVEYDAFLAAA